MRERLFKAIAKLMATAMILTSVNVPVLADPGDSVPTSGRAGDSLTWSYDGVDTLTFSGSGDMYDYTPDGGFEYQYYEDEITNLVLPSGMTSIGAKAFKNLSITTVDIPDNVTSIGDSAFYACSYLTEAHLPESLESIGNYAFSYCSALNKVNIPSSLAQTVGQQCFSGCPLSTIEFDGNTVIPDYLFDSSSMTEIEELKSLTTLKTIGEYAFKDCSNLEKVVMPDSVTAIGEYAFHRCKKIEEAHIPSGLKKLNDGVFENCTSLNKVNIPSSLTEASVSYPFLNCPLGTIEFDGNTVIPDHLFECSSITEIDELKTLNSLKTIGKSAFRNCQKLKKAEIPDSVTAIGENAFISCTKMTEAHIPSEITKLEPGVFSYCSSLDKINIPKTLKEASPGSVFYSCPLGTIEFSGNTVIPDYLFESSAMTEIDEIKNLSSLNTIGINAFYGCSKLEKVEIPDSVENVGKFSFHGCKSLKEAHIPTGIRKIGTHAFDKCISLNKVNIPSSLTESDGVVFMDCPLGTITFDGNTIIPNNLFAFSAITEIDELKTLNTLKTIDIYAFQSCEKLKSITVPTGVMEVTDGAFRYCNSLKRVVNFSEAEIDLTEIKDGAVWKNALTRKVITTIKNGTAVRNDGEEEEERLPTEEEIYELIYASLPRSVKGNDVEISGPKISIAGQEISTFNNKLGFDFSILDGKVQPSFEYDGNNQTLKFMIGTKAVEGEKNQIIPRGKGKEPGRKWDITYTEMRSFYKDIMGEKAGTRDLYNHYRTFQSKLAKSHGAVGLEGEVSVFGYFELKLDYDEERQGWYTTKLNEGGLVVKGEGEVSYTVYPFAAPLFFVYLQPSLSGELEGSVKFINGGTTFVGLTDMALDAEGEIALAAAIGAGSEDIDLYAKGGVKGTIGAEANVLPQPKLNKVTATIGGFVEWCVFNLPFATRSWEETGWEWELYPECKQTKNVFHGMQEILTYHKPVTATPGETAELLRNSAGAIDPSDSIYRFSGMQLTELGGRKLLLTYLDDSVEGAQGKVKLMYRLYDGTGWSAGAVVNNGTFADSNGTVSILNDTPYLIYQGTEEAINEGDGVDDITEKLALYAARFNGSTFDEAVKIGETGKNRYSYQIFYEGGHPEAVWAENLPSASESEPGKTRILKCSLDPAAVPETVTEISGSGGRAVISGNSSGIRYIYYDGSETVKVNGTEISAPEKIYSAFFSGDRIWLQSEGKLYEYDGEVKDSLVSCNSICRVYGDQAYFTAGDSFSSELYRKSLFSTEPAIRITDEGGSIESFDVIPGEIPSEDRISYAFRSVDEERSNPYGLCTIKFTDAPVRYSASIGNIGYDVLDFEPGENNKVYLTVENTGTEPLNNATVKAFIGNQEIFSKKIEDRMETNEVKDLILDIPFPSDYDGTEVRYVLSSDEELNTEASEGYEFDYSLTDLSITQSGSDSILVTESDKAPAKNVVLKLYDSFEEDSRLIRTVNAGDLRAGGTFTETVTKEDWKKVRYDEASGFKDMIVSVSTTDKEYQLGNNSCVLSIRTEKDPEEENGNGNGNGNRVDPQDQDPNRNQGTASEDGPKNPDNAPTPEKVLKNTSSETLNAGQDTVTVSWNSYTLFDGRKHFAAGSLRNGETDRRKDSTSKAFDIGVVITRNGEAIDPSLIRIKTKNNKSASVSIDGVTAIITDQKKKPSFTVKISGKENKDLNDAFKGKSFSFGIIPAELKGSNTTFDKVKTGKDGKVKIKKLTFKPADPSGKTSLKPLKLKSNKKEEKTDYVTETDPDGRLKVVGRNNYYGSVTY